MLLLSVFVRAPLGVVNELLVFFLRFFSFSFFLSLSSLLARASIGPSAAVSRQRACKQVFFNQKAERSHRCVSSNPAPVLGESAKQQAAAQLAGSCPGGGSKTENRTTPVRTYTSPDPRDQALFESNLRPERLSIRCSSTYYHTRSHPCLPSRISRPENGHGF